jgi:hypothetical protein
MTGVTSVVRTPPHYSGGKGPVDEEDEEEDEDEASGFRIHHH